MKQPVYAFFALALLIIISPAASAISPVNKTTLGGLAIKGYDPVSYFTDGAPAKGDKRFEIKHGGAQWRFATQAHLDLFKANPEKYAPQYGGYCAWAVSQGYTANVDPEAWKIINDKLYLNYNKSVQARWERDARVNIGMADSHWPVLLKKNRE